MFNSILETSNSKTNENHGNSGHSIDYKLTNYFNIFSQGFLLITLSELGDKSQISTIYLSATLQPIHVFLASIIAQYILSVIAVFFGNFISDKISEKNLTMFAGGMFIVFAFITLLTTLANLPNFATTATVQALPKVPQKLFNNNSTSFLKVKPTIKNMNKLNNIILKGNIDKFVNLDNLNRFLNSTK